VTRPLSLLRRFRRSEAGSAAVEFVIAVPLVLAFLFSSIDFGVVMLRQVFLDRSVDIAVRQVRLGNITGSEFPEFRQMICDNSFLIADCENSIAIELRPINTVTWAGLDTPAQCVNREQELSPVLAFTPGAGLQELMLIRVCAVVDPFIDMTGLILGMPEDNSGGFFLVSHAAFANEPA
jgi:Flp pilus assembly protein TadG